MSKLSRIIGFFVVIGLLTSCTAPAKIVRHPKPDDYSELNVYTQPPTGAILDPKALIDEIKR